MLAQTMYNRPLILAFMVVVGFMLAKSLNAGNALGIILSLVSLAASVYYLYLVLKYRAEAEEENNR